MFYLVSQEDFDTKFKQKPQLTDKLEIFPNRLEKKVRKILDFLLASGLTWNVYGVTSSSIPELNTQFSILEFVIYSAKAQGKEPLGFQKFPVWTNKLVNYAKKKKTKTEESQDQIHFI